MTPDELRARTRQFALDVAGLCAALGNDELSRAARPQLMRSATGIAANYRAATRARSRQEFAARLGVVVEETDESELWLDLLESRRVDPADRIAILRREAVQLRAIFAKSRTTTLRNLQQQRLQTRLRRTR